MNEAARRGRLRAWGIDPDAPPPPVPQADDDDLTRLRDDLTQLMRDDDELLAALATADEPDADALSADDLTAAAENLRAMAADFAAGRTWPDHRPSAALIQQLQGAAVALDALVVLNE
jgi:hypothetical protein